MDDLIIEIFIKIVFYGDYDYDNIEAEPQKVININEKIDHLNSWYEEKFCLVIDSDAVWMFARGRAIESLGQKNF